jgi:hypothetical protein
MHPLQITAQPLSLERLLHDQPVMPVLGGIHQHHAAFEERTDEVVPSPGAGEGPVAVGQHG